MKTRFAAIDGLRALLALYVVFHHIGHRIWTKATIPFGGQLLELGHMAVAMFIVISGCCLMLPILKHNGFQYGVGNFFKRRAIRILPSCITAALLGAVALVITNQSLGTWVSAILNIGFLQDYALRTHQSWNNPLWSVAVEERIYILFALAIVPLWKRLSLWIIVVGCFALTVPLSWFTYKTPWDWSFPHFLGLFSLGMVAATAIKKGWWERLPLWAIIAPCLVTAAYFQIYTYYNTVGYWPMYIIDGCTGVAGMCLLVCVVRSRSSLFTWQPLVFAGERSYSLYLYHLPIMTVLMLAVPATASVEWKALFWISTLPVVLVFCYLGYLCVERPCLKSLRSTQPSCTPARRQLAMSPLA